jgi:hypothetical protein
MAAKTACCVALRRYLAMRARLVKRNEVNATGICERKVTDRLLPPAMAQV